MSGKRIFGGLLLGLLIVTMLAISGAVIYQAGFTHGAMTNLSLPEGREFPIMPYGRVPLGWQAGPRIGLLGLFPLLCFGCFFFLVFLCGFGLISRRHAWKHYYGSESQAEYWKHHGPPPWGSGQPPWVQNQPENKSDTSPAGTDQAES